jgi:redox-sensitive bicupin YhaK (pirin superfamily)
MRWIVRPGQTVNRLTVILCDEEVVMGTIRKVNQILKSRPTLEGAGVHLKRAFGFQRGPRLDPFLLLDDFSSDSPEDYLPGFPWHPHRGIETITYILRGAVAHGDSMGNKGVINAGDVQWMTAGSGIVHQEMPQQVGDGRLAGFQLWANLPAKQKMMPPRYRGITDSQIPTVRLENGIAIRVICGSLNGVRGPVQDIVIDPEYLDVSMPAGATFTHPVQPGYTVFAYVFDGQATFDDTRERAVGVQTLVTFKDGDGLEISSEAESVRFLLVSGKPLNEPVAWYGPIVMNTQAELELAFEEYRNGTFLKHKDAG